MKFNIKPAAIFISLVFIITSCSKTNDEGKMIPNNALAVMHLNTKSLSAKLSWNEIKQTNWFKEIYSDTSIKPWTKKLMDNPDSTGIDFNSGLILFVQKPAGTEGQIVFEGEIKNEKSFKAFNENLSENIAATKDGDINILALKEEAVVGWNNKKFAYVINASGFTHRMKHNMDTLESNTGLAGAQNLTLICKNLFGLKTDNSMAKNNKFSSLIKEEGDVHVWQNTEEIANSSAQMGALGTLKLDFLLKGNISTFTGSFENGKINVKQKLYVSPELTDVIKKYFAGKINTDMVKNIPSQNINGLLVLHFKPEGIKELIKLTGMDGFLNIFLSGKNLTLDDFVKANKGDIMFAVTDFTMKRDSVNLGDEANKSNSYYEKPTASFLFSASIGDKPSFNKLLDAGKKEGGDIISSAGIFYANDDRFFAVGNSQQYVSKYIAGSNNKPDFIEKIEDHPFALFIDIQKILTTAALQPVKDNGNQVIMEESLKTWQNVYSMGGEYKDDAFILNSEINLVDKNTNSLKQLNSYFDKISKVMIEKNKKNKERWGQADSTIYPPMEMDTIPAKP
ncbi:MAG: DUF4836 family protein [Ginsengibacter sp.]